MLSHQKFQFVYSVLDLAHKIIEWYSDREVGIVYTRKGPSKVVRNVYGNVIF